MALSIATIANPTDSANPIIDAYGVISRIALSMSGTGSLDLSIHPNSGAASRRDHEISVISVYLGQIYGQSISGAGQEHFATFGELMANPEFLAAYNAISGILYTELLKHPKLVGSKIV